jgi:hypothetical protein
LDFTGDWRAHTRGEGVAGSVAIAAAGGLHHQRMQEVANEGALTLEGVGFVPAAEGAGELGSGAYPVGDELAGHSILKRAVSLAFAQLHSRSMRMRDEAGERNPPYKVFCKVCRQGLENPSPRLIFAIEVSSRLWEARASRVPSAPEADSSLFVGRRVGERRAAPVWARGGRQAAWLPVGERDERARDGRLEPVRSGAPPGLDCGELARAVSRARALGLCAWARRAELAEGVRRMAWGEWVQPCPERAARRVQVEPG